MRPEQISSFNSENWNSKHPLIAPYFLEFHPLISPEGGVANYSASMAYDSFFSDDITNDETTYLSSLIEHARKLGRVPVITCTRSLGRMTALKKEFGGLHLVLYRNIFHQWCSYTEQWFNGNPSFIETVWLALTSKQRDKIAGDIARIYPSNDRSALNPNNFFAFVLLHIHLYARAADAATCIIDIDDIQSNATSRASLEGLIFNQTGLEIDFSGVRQKPSFSLVDIGNERVLTDTINAFPEILNHPKTPGGIEFISKVTNDLITEYKKYSKTALPVVKACHRQIELIASQQSDLGRQREEISSLQAEIYRQQQETAALKAETSRQQVEINGLHAELSKQQEEINLLQSEAHHRIKEDNLLQSTVHEKNEEIALLNAKLFRQRDEMVSMTVDLEKIRSSTSWRLTSPMRTTKAFLQRFAKNKMKRRP